MSLLLIGSSSRISHGLLRQFISSNKYEKIVCADPYSSYWGIYRHHKFLESLGEKKLQTKLQDIQIIEKSDLVGAVRKATDVVYVTHDYYQNCPSKVNYLKQTNSVVKEVSSVKRFVAVTPVELDNFNEPVLQIQDQQEKEVLESNPKAVIVKSDITFGPDSVLVTRILEKLFAKQGITFKPQGGGPAPILTSDLALGVQALLNGNQAGQKYLAQGKQRVDWETFFDTLQKASYNHVGAPIWENIITPTHVNLISDFIYDRNYIQTCQTVAKYHPPNHIGTEEFSTLVADDKITEFTQYYQNAKINSNDFLSSKGSVEQLVRNKLY